VARPAGSGDNVTVARKGKPSPVATSPVEEPPPEPSAAESIAATEPQLPAEPETAPTGPSKEESPSQGESAPAPLTEAEARTIVREYIERLRSDAETADQAFRELWEVRKDLIPALILEAENPQPSALKKLSILVLDRQRFVRIDEAQDKIVYSIPGMGNFRYDDVAAGPTRSGLGAKAVFRSFQKPFAVGVVLRAALVNRFRSADYPSGDAAADPIGWWQRFHEKVAAKL
jgi:hypothetical protein